MHESNLKRSDKPSARSWKAQLSGIKSNLMVDRWVPSRSRRGTSSPLREIIHGQRCIRKCTLFFSIISRRAQIKLRLNIILITDDNLSLLLFYGLFMYASSYRWRRRCHFARKHRSLCAHRWSLNGVIDDRQPQEYSAIYRVLLVRIKPIRLILSSNKEIVKDVTPLNSTSAENDYNCNNRTVPKISKKKSK